MLDLRIDLKPSYLLLPKSGFYDSNSDLMIIDFGYLKVREGSQNIFKRELFLSIKSDCKYMCVRVVEQRRPVQPSTGICQFLIARGNHG